MVYHSQKMNLSEVQLVSENESGRVTVCEDLASPERTRYSVFITSDHEIIARLHRAYNNANNISPDSELNYFSDQGEYLVVYPYVPARPLSRFYMGRDLPIPKCEEIVKNYIITCLATNLPWQVLYLVLSQGLVNMARDGSVYLSYTMDLSLLDEDITESDCVGLCVGDILRMLSQKPNNIRWDLRALLVKRNERQAFNKFTDLYHDYEVVAGRHSKRGLIRRIILWFEENKDQLFRVLLVISIILVVFTLVTFLTNAIFGDVPWLRFFIRSFERIGTQSLVQ